MQTEQSLLRLLLSRDFYLNNKDRISENFFEAELKDIFKTIVDAQEKYQHDLTLEEVKALHLANSPTLSRAAKNNVFEVFSDMEALEGISEDVAGDLLEAMWKKETFRRLAEIGVRGIEGQVTDLEEVKKLLDDTNAGFTPDTGIDYVSNDLGELLASTDRTNAWHLNIPSIAEKLPGVAGGEFMILAARPESGKTAAYVSLTCAPGGFAWQGARVLIVANEEPGRRTLLRCVTAACQKDAEWVRNNQREARQIWNKIADKIILVDAVGLTMSKLNSLVRANEPDVLILDQADKISVAGSYSASHEKIREIYIQIREVAKRYDCFTLGICQASAEAEGKSVVNYSMLEGSKTGKAAEADVIAAIGKLAQGEGQEEDFCRIWTFSKNKISGFHGSIYTILDPSVSTYRS